MKRRGFLEFLASIPLVARACPAFEAPEEKKPDPEPRWSCAQNAVPVHDALTSGWPCMWVPTYGQPPEGDGR